MKANVRVGVLGCAGIATRRVLPAMLAAPEIELVAVASRDEAKARRVAEQFGCLPVTGYANVFDLVEAVYIPLPAALHAEWAERALRAGKHVLVEKPMTTSLARTRELIALASQAQRVLIENFMFLHHPQHESAKVQDIGEWRSFEAAFTIPRLPEGDIRYRPELGGGALLDVGVYPLRVARLFLGDLEVLGSWQRHEGGVDVAGAALLSNKDGVTAQLTWGMDHVYRASYDLWGTRGHVRVDRAYAPPACAEADQYLNAMRAFAHAVRQGAWSQSEAIALADLVERCSSGAGKA